MRKYRKALSSTFLFIVFSGISCASSKGKNPSVAAPVAESEKFVNPGGMWMPQQLADHAATLRKLGLAYDPKNLTDPTMDPLAAIVSLGNCSASFVSPQGLLITNHHCVTAYLQANSTPEANLLTDGFVAASQAEEKPGTPASRVFVTQKISDVTATVRNGLDEIQDDQKRYETIEQRRKELVHSCEEQASHLRCSVASFFEGEQFYLLEQLEIRDVRLVYAPHAGIGVFGGDIDNWRWPRHTGDFALLRAYVGKDGKPADFSSENIPYSSQHYLPIAKDKVQAGDLVMVAGYPGRTTRLKTAKEVEEAANWYYPRQIEAFRQYIAVLERLGEEDPTLAIKVADKLKVLSNYLINYEGMRDGLVQGGLAEKKSQTEQELRAWIQSDPEREANYGEALTRMDSLLTEWGKAREKRYAQAEIVQASSLLSIAAMLVELEEELKKPDAERRAEYQERNWSALKQRLMVMGKKYDPRIDRSVLKLFLQRSSQLPEEQQPELLTLIIGGGSSAPDAADIDRALDRLYSSRQLGDPSKWPKLMEQVIQGKSRRKLSSSNDPWLRLAIQAKPILDQERARGEAYNGAMAALRPRYVAALRSFQKSPMAPDANSTLRISYGTVRGYQPKLGAATFQPFTSISELMAKHTGKDPFDVPHALRNAAEAKHFGPYQHEKLGELSVNFLADLDITGGNSGSATLNAKGELTGLAFDGNYESIASDWLFMPEVTRSIHVDIRYVLWVMDAVDKADHLLAEMDVKPVI